MTTYGSPGVAPARAWAAAGSASANDTALQGVLDNRLDAIPGNDDNNASGGRFAVGWCRVAALQREPARGQPGRQHRVSCSLGSDYLVDLELSAAQAEGRGEVISTPSIITANQREAGDPAGCGNSATRSPLPRAPRPSSSRKPSSKLRVTPRETPDNRIILDLNIKKDSVGQIIAGGAGQQVP